jgi:WD40 repeat protein
LRERDFASGREIQTWQLGGRFQEAFGIAPDGKSCVAINYDGECSLRNLVQQSSDSLGLHILEAASVSFSPDGKLLVVGSDLGLARVWQTATWQPVTTLSGFLWSAHTVIFSPTGRRLAIGGGDKEAVKLFDTESWQHVFTLEGRNTDFHGLAFSPDESAIGWLNMDGQLQIWRAPSWDEIHAAEAKDLPAQGNGVTGRMETQQPGT